MKKLLPPKDNVIMEFQVVIPARYASTRLPGKPLRVIGDKPMIQWVYELATKAGAAGVVVATDDQRIADCVQGFGGEYCLTADSHESGTDRIAEVSAKYNWPDETIIVNLQGDEPAMPPALLRQVAEDMADNPSASVTTLYSGLTDRKSVFDPNTVKLVQDKAGFALYFSRAPIPWLRDQFSDTSLDAFPEGIFARHIGLYAYRAGFLKRYVSWDAAELEQFESLEQLRVLSQGEKIHVSEALQHSGHGVDTEADLQQVAHYLAGQ